MYWRENSLALVLLVKSVKRNKIRSEPPISKAILATQGEQTYQSKEVICKLFLSVR